MMAELFLWSGDMGSAPMHFLSKGVEKGIFRQVEYLNLIGNRVDAHLVIGCEFNLFLTICCQNSFDSGA